MAEERKLEGFLMKQGEGVAGIGKGYKKRWFSQKGTCLYYYRSKTDTQEQGFINLAEALSCHATDGGKGKWQFQINTPRRIWHLESETEEGMKYWIDGIGGLLDIMKDEERAERSHDRRSVRIEQMDNRINDLEVLNTQYEKALRAAAAKLGVSFEELLGGGGANVASASATSAANGTAGKSSSSESSNVEVAEAANDAKSEDKNKAADTQASSGASASASSSAGGEDGDKKDTRFKAKVLYDYIAQQDYEMTIHNNEIITVMSKHGNGWWLGSSSDGKQGYFPGSYVEPIAGEA